MENMIQNKVLVLNLSKLNYKMVLTSAAIANRKIFTGTSFFVKPMLWWQDRLNKKSLSGLRHSPTQQGFDEVLFRIKNLTLVFNAVIITNNASISDVVQSSKVDKDQCQWLNYVNHNCCLSNFNGFVKINGTLSIHSEVLLFITLFKFTLVAVLTETWLNSIFNNRVLLLVGQYDVIFRNDRINGSPGGVANVLKFGANLSVEHLPQPSMYDFCACVMVLANVIPLNSFLSPTRS